MPGLAYTRELGLPELFVVEAEYRKVLMEAELGYVESLVTRIEKDELGGTRWWRRIHELADEGISLEEVFRDPVKHLGEEVASIAHFLKDG